jgi:hypothetical protein
MVKEHIDGSMAPCMRVIGRTIVCMVKGSIVIKKVWSGKELFSMVNIIMVVSFIPYDKLISIQ